MILLLRQMLKEEQRIHTNAVGNLLFMLFPFLIILIVMVSSFYAPLVELLEDGTLPGLVFHLLFVFFGMNIGAFGVYGKEFMHRRFGHASLIAYSSRTLPISQRTIFSTVVLKDIVYYFALFILPAVIGIEIASSVQGVPQSFTLYLMSSLTLSFLLGVSGTFLLSTVYARSVKLLLASLAGIGLCVWVFIASGGDAMKLIPPYAFFLDPTWKTLSFTLILILLFFLLSFKYYNVEYREDVRRRRNGMAEARDPFTRKDFLDLSRSEGGLGRIVFSLVLPMGLIWVFLSFFVSYLTIANFLLIFSVFLGVYSSSVYSWLSEYDSFGQYVFLPIPASTVIRGKLRTTAIISLISLVIFFLAVLKEESLWTIVLGLSAFASLYLYGLGVTIYLTGLTPNISFFSAKNMFRYLAYIIPPAITLLVISVVRPSWMLWSLVLAAVGLGMVKVGMAKWDRAEQQVF